MVERLNKNDYDELLSFLNEAFEFGEKDGFMFQLPAMWHRTDECIGKNIAIRENGKIIAAMSIFPLKVHIGNEVITLATTGNVGVDKSCRGRGLMKVLMNAANERIIGEGIDAARLGGHRQLYQQYGYDYAGTSLLMRIEKENVLRAKLPHSFTFKKLSDADTEILSEIHSLQKNQTVYAERKDEDFFNIMSAWCNIPYAAYDSEGNFVGGIAAASDNIMISEFFAVTPGVAFEMLCSWLMSGSSEKILFSVDPQNREFIRIAGKHCEAMTEDYATQLKIYNWEHFTNAYLSIRKDSKISETFILNIDGYGSLKIGYNHCEKTNETADVTLNSLDATRFLFGYQGSENVCEVPADKSEIINKILPIPMWWGSQDRV